MAYTKPTAKMKAYVSYRCVDRNKKGSFRNHIQRLAGVMRPGGRGEGYFLSPFGNVAEY